MGADDSEVSEDMVEVPVDYSEDEPEEEEPDGQEFYAKWTDAYKEAREYLYGTPQIEPDEEAAYEIMKEEAGKCLCNGRHGIVVCTGYFCGSRQDESTGVV